MFLGQANLYIKYVNSSQYEFLHTLLLFDSAKSTSVDFVLYLLNKYKHLIKRRECTGGVMDSYVKLKTGTANLLPLNVFK